MLRQTSLVGLALGLASLSSAQVTNDFESGWDQTAWPVYAPDCQQGGTVTLDTTTAHSGKNSMRVDGAGGYCGHAFFGTNNIPTGDLYVRTWLKASKAIGDSHVTFMVLPDPAEGTNKHLRIGGMSQILLYNRESDDATLPELSPQGIASSKGLPANTWECFEYHIGTDGTIETWLNGEAIPGLSYGPGITNPNAGAWSRSTVKPKPTGVYFGWESYGGDANTFWFDDVAIGSSRIGCGTTGGGSSSSATSSKTTLVTSTKTTTTSSTKSTTASEGTTPWSTSSTISKTSAAPTSTTTPSGCTASQWSQCDGIGYTGCKTCAAPYTCKYNNDWYSQCL